MQEDTNKDPVRSFLSSYWEMRKEGERLERRIEEMTAQAEKVTSVISDTPRGGKKETGNPVWDALVDTKTRCGENMVAALKREAEIEAFIRSLDGPVIRQLLRYRYLELMSWEQMAAEMNYTERHIYRLHGAALKEARRVWELDHPAGEEESQHGSV